MSLSSTLKNHHGIGKNLRYWKKLTAVDPGTMLFHHNCGDHYILRRSISNPLSTGSAGFHQVPLLLCHAQISLHVPGGMNRDISRNTLPTTTQWRQYHASPFVLEKNKEDNEKEGFYDHVHNLFHPSKVDLFWKTHLEKVSKPEAREVVQYLDHECPLGFDAYSHIDRDYASQDFDDYNEDEMYEDYDEDEVDNGEDEDHEYEYKEDEDYPNATYDDEDSFDHDDDDVTEFCRDVRKVYPQCLVVGRPMLDEDDNESANTNKNNNNDNNDKKDDKVFRAFGVDCVLLLEYTSFLKVKKAHSAILEIPEARLQEALDALTKRGFSIVVVEAALPTTKPKKQSKKNKKKKKAPAREPASPSYPYVAQIITPEAPTYSHNRHDEKQRQPKNFIPPNIKQ